MTNKYMKRGISKKKKIELPYITAVPLLGIQLKELQSGFQSDICTVVFIATLFTIVEIRMKDHAQSVQIDENRKFQGFFVCLFVCLEISTHFAMFQFQSRPFPLDVGNSCTFTFTIQYVLLLVFSSSLDVCHACLYLGRWLASSAHL